MEGFLTTDLEPGYIKFHSRKPSRVPLLTQRHKTPSLTWTRQHRLWSLNDWKNAVWSDESCFQLYRADTRVRMGRKPNESLDLACLQGIVQTDGGSGIV
ncbi:transposable element Tcb2 transposase [Trichonephila clavipes]|nr:transposable element Tcb2 transposase [Trichonephila clavipes]